MSLQAKDDDFYMQLVEAVKQHKKVTDMTDDPLMKDYMGVWSELGVEETRAGTLVTMDGRLMVPEVTRNKILEALHRCHPGTPTMVANARHLY